MNDERRRAAYARQNRGGEGLTPAQRRRWRKKLNTSTKLPPLPGHDRTPRPLLDEVDVSRIYDVPVGLIKPYGIVHTTRARKGGRTHGQA